MHKNQTVIGSYPTEKEAELVVKRLLDEGHAKEDLIIFTSQDKSQELDNPQDIDVAKSDMSGTHMDHEDKSFWESLKDAFRVRDDEYYEDPNYVVEDDLLHMYRDDLKKGHVIVAVHKQDDEATSDTEQEGANRTGRTAADSETLDTLGTTAGFPDEGSVQGMGDGGQPPLEPKSNDGTPPELEDTHGEADADAATKDRLDQNRNEGLDA